MLVAASGRAAVVLVRDGDRVRFHSANPDRLIESLVLRLPDVPPGRGESISIRATDYGPVDGTSGRLLRQPVLDLIGEGRWAVYPTEGRGERAVNAVPATSSMLVTKLTELHSSVRFPH